jgi:FecR-like protein
MPTSIGTLKGQLGAAALLLIAAIPLQAAAADQQIGAAALVVNSVTGTLATTRERTTLRAGIDVFQNEAIDTGETSASRVVFQDQTELSIGALSEVVLDRFVFDPDPSRSQVAVSIAKGVARFSTGLLPKPDYVLRTPVATIGIRGTRLTITVSATKATTVSVESGTAFVTAQGRTVTVDAGFSSLVEPGRPPTPAVPSPPPPFIAIQMNALLDAAAGILPGVGTRVGSRAAAADMPQLGGSMMMSPNLDPKVRAEIAGDATPPNQNNPNQNNSNPDSAGSRGSHGSRGTHCGAAN